MENIGNMIVDSDLPVLVKVMLIIGVAALILVITAVIIILGVEYLFTPDYDFIPALLQNPGAALSEVQRHLVFIPVRN